MKKDLGKGISLRKMNFVMTGVTIVVSLCLLAATFITSSRYLVARQNADDYVNWSGSAEKMLTGSDYLTEQARIFAFSERRENLDNYFKEATQTKRRDEALNVLSEDLSETEAYKKLRNAMNESTALMITEYHSMRLIVEAIGDDVSNYPKEIQDVELTKGEKNLSAFDKRERALSLLYNANYELSKNIIRQSTEECIVELGEILKNDLSVSFGELNVMLYIQQALIILLVLFIVATLLLTAFQVIRPLTEAVPHIRDEKPLPVKGASEYRFLARTYNKMYEISTMHKKELAYEANHDKLTGLFNRSGFEQFLVKADLSSCAFVLIDVDDFKSINDRNGHDVGDRSLALLADKIRAHFRTGDCMSRLGGDEFIVVMPGVTGDALFKDKIVEKINAINAELRVDRNVPVFSISAGVAFGNGNADTDSLLKQADEALYSAKKDGKKVCRFYSESK